MKYSIHCGDVMKGCPVWLEADTVDELLGSIVEHAGEAHGLADFSEDTERQVRDAIQEDGDA